MFLTNIHSTNLTKGAAFSANGGPRFCRERAARVAASRYVYVATPSRPPTSKVAKRSKVEILKENSDFLRHPLMTELVSEATNISEDAGQLMKFHGSYQQDDREKRTMGQGKFYQFMMRTRQPGGIVSNQLYLTMDDLSKEFGNGTLRLTTRQTYQLHGVLKQDLKTVFSSVVKAMGTTLGACGDVNRSFGATIRGLLRRLAGRREVRQQRPGGSPEPIYGAQFLPRKFKIAVTVPGDNSVDLLTNDVGIVVMTQPDGTLIGYDVYVGGGMGRTHRNNNTFASVAQPLGFVGPDDIFHIVKAIVSVQRDYGRRDDRKQARLKYLIHEWGIERFRKATEQYFGKKIEEFRPLPPWEFKNYLGWMDQGDGKEAYGIYVQNGRLKGEPKKAIRSIVEKYNIPVIITPNQNLLLVDIEPQWKDSIVKTLAEAEIKDIAELDNIEVGSMACPALPLCGLAITEAERGLPDVNKRIREVMRKVGLDDQESFVVRMTGCPNGCSRPYMAELGFVGDGPNSYQMWLGGSPNQTRLAKPFLDRVKVQKLEETLEPLFRFFKDERANAAESFGDFTNRVGFEKLKEYTAKATA